MKQFALYVFGLFFGANILSAQTADTIKYVLTLGDAIKVGLAIAVIGGVISAVYSYIHYSYVYPEFIEMTLDEARLQIAERSPNMSEEQIEQTLEVSKMFTSPIFFSLMSVVGSLFFGIIISLIAGLVMKKENSYA